MKIRTLFFVFICFPLAIGCGNSTKITSPDQDELTRYVAEHPEMANTFVEDEVPSP
jgi:hypothetical protein